MHPKIFIHFLTVLLLVNYSVATEWTHQRVVCSRSKPLTDWSNSLIAVTEDQLNVLIGSVKSKLIASSLNNDLLAVDLGSGDLRIISKLKQASDEDIESLISSVSELKYSVLSSPKRCKVVHT